MARELIVRCHLIRTPGPKGFEDYWQRPMELGGWFSTRRYRIHAHIAGGM